MPQTKMQVDVQCFHCEVDEELRAHCEDKLAAVERMWDNAQRASVRLSGFRGRFSAEITLVSDGQLTRAEERGDSLRAAFDIAIAKLQRQLSDYKKKVQRSKRRHNNRDDATGTVLHPLGLPDLELAASANSPANIDSDVSSDGRSGTSINTRNLEGTIYGVENPALDGVSGAMDEDEVVVRVKRFALKPMSPEEASLQMDLLGHGFFVFRHAVTNEVSVVYRRHSGGYGLIEPVNG